MNDTVTTSATGLTIGAVIVSTITWTLAGVAFALGLYAVMWFITSDEEKRSAWPKKIISWAVKPLSWLSTKSHDLDPKGETNEKAA